MIAPARHVVLLAGGAPVLGFELAAVAEVLASAGEGRYRVDVRTVGGAVGSAVPGVTVDAPAARGAEVRSADLLVVAGPAHRQHPGEQVLEHVATAATAGARVMSVCSAAFVLAHAGLLDGHRATTHWWYTDELATRFPAVEVVPDVLFVDDGQVLTSAGSAASIDLTLHVVRSDLGASVANDAARAMVVPPVRTGGQAQFVDRPRIPDPPGTGLAEICDWALDHLDERLDVATLASRAAMSPRTFARRFRDEVGSTPHRWLVAQRVDRARALLEDAAVDIDTVARAVGFESADTLRARFRERTGLSPSEYRRRFCCPEGTHPGAIAGR